jgi:hypothetical protein
MTKAGASSNPGFTVAVNPTQQSQCALSSTGVGAAGAYAVTVRVTDNPIVYLGQTVVPANTITIPTPLSLTVNPAIAFSLPANFDNYSFTPTGAGTSAEVPDAVNGRTYGAVGPYGTAGPAGGETSLVFTATGGLLTTQGLTFTPPAASTLPAPVQCGPATGVTYPQVSATAATMVCSSGGTAVSGSPGPFPFVVTVGDVGNTATPTGSTMTDTLGHSSHTLKVDAPLTFSLAQAGNPTTTNPANLLDAVSGRSYGVINSGYAAPTYTPAGGLGANETTVGTVGNSYYQWCLSTGALPATFNSTGNNLNVACSTAQVQSPSETLQATNDLATVASTTPYPFTVQLNDTGNLTTPSGTFTGSTTTLTVQPPLVATLMQNGTTIASGGALLPGVYNRTYGVGGGTPTFTAAGGLGAISGGLGGNYQWCLSAGALPTGFLNTGTNLNNSSTCASPVVENTATLAANPITLLSPAPTSATQSNFTVRLDDGGNAAVPNGFASGTTPDPANVVSSSITVNPQIQLAQSLGTNWPDAVNGRAYGSPAGGPSVTGCTGGTGACAPAVYSATGGLGGYHWPTTPASILAITGMSCSVVSTTYQCSAADIAAAPSAAGATSQSYSPSATVTDTPNAATPAANTTTDPASTRTDTLWVDAPLLATLTQTGDTPTATNPTNLIPGVSGRSYAVGALAAAAPTYTATGGLGARAVADYEWCVDSGAASVPAGLTGITVEASSAPCSTFAQTAVNSETLTSSDITATILPAASQTFSPTVELDDTGNASAPSSNSSGTEATRGTSLLINAPLAINLTQATSATTSATNPAALLPAVVGRSYGVINANAGEPTYTASYGLGGYVFPASPGPFSSSSGFTCSSTTTNPYTCSASTVAYSSSTNPYALSLTVTDTANPAVPNGSATATTGLLVNPTITLTTNNGPNWPDAVVGRPYGLGGAGSGCTGTGGACAAMIYTAAGGLGAVGEYTFTNASFPSPLACTPTGATLTLTCATPSTGTTTMQTAGPTHPVVTAVDVANWATPAATTTTDAGSTQTDSLIVDAALGVGLTQTGNSTPSNPPTLLPGVQGRSYAVGALAGAAPTYAGTGGLGATGSTLGAAAYEWCVNSAGTGMPSGLVGIGTSCGASSTTKGAASESLSTGTGTIASNATVQTYSFTAELDDPGNPSTPASSLGGGTAGTRGTTLPINAALAVTPSPLVSGAFPPAVVNRSYGTNGTGIGACSGGLGNCVPITYTVTAGSGLPNSSGGYSFSAITDSNTNGAGDFPTGFSCPAVGAAATVYTCTASPAVATSVTPTPATFTPSVTVTDTANAAVPSGNVPVTQNLVVNPNITLALTIGGAPYTTGTAWPVGVLGRPYGSGNGCTGGAACVPPTFTATNGLGAVGGYTFSNDASLTGVGFTCNPSSPSLTCSATDLTSGFTPSVTATDVANATTPAATTTTDPNSIFTSTNPVTANPELTITNTFLENATVGEPYSAILDSNRMGLGSPYLWCAGTISNGVCTPSGGIEGVSFVTPSPAITDDPSGNIRGYYRGTPTTAGGASTTISLSDEGNATTPACSWVATCPPPLALTTAATEPKVFAANGFAATFASNAGEKGDTLFGFDTNAFTTPYNLALDAGGNPVTPRVTPEGNWVYVTEQGSQQVAVIDPTGSGSHILSTTVSNGGTFNPTSMDIEPQQYLTPNPNTCAANCSNLGSFIRYDAYVVDPTVNNHAAATIEPLPDAEDPGLLPASPSKLASGNALTLADAGYGPNSFAVSTDAAHGFLSLGYLPFGTPCAALPSFCNSFAALSLTAPSTVNATTTAGYYSAFTGQTPTTFNTFGSSGGAVTVDPNGASVASVTASKSGTFYYLTVTTTGAAPAFVTYIPPTAGVATLPTTSVCSASGLVYTPVAAKPTALAVSPEGNRMFVACLDTANNPQTNDTITVWDISGTSSGIPFIQSIALPQSVDSTTDASATIAENGCTTPTDIKAKLSTNATFGTRLFVNCQDSDTILAYEYNSGAGSNALDSASLDASAGNVLISATVTTDWSTATTPVMSSIGNAAAPPYVNACGNTGSCPQNLDLTPNPTIHFTTGGYVGASPFALPAASIAAGSYSYYVVAQGGAVPRTFTETTAAPVLLGAGGTGACQNLSLASSGLISGTPTNQGTCGPFTIRVTDGSAPGQFVERTFTLTVGP